LEKDEREKLDEIIRLLRKLLSKEDYRPRLESRVSRNKLAVAKGGGSYKPRNYFPQHYQAYQGSRSKSEEKKYESREKTSSYSAKPWNEPMQYQPRERLVYDPEVKQILKSIEQKLSSEPEAEEILRQLENNPELYEKLVERLSEGLEKVEAKEPDLDEEIEKDSEQSSKGAEESIEQEPSEEAKPAIGTEIEDEGNVQLEEVLEKLGEEEGMPILQLDELKLDKKSEAQQIGREEVIEPLEEHSDEVIQKIEAQDLSQLEEELYEEPTEPLELEQQIEAERVNIRLEQEMLDDPVFWQNSENELIERRFKASAQNSEVEMDEYGY
jgi:hypothetical protein